MSLKDRLNDALNETPPENAARQETLRAVLDASGNGTDAEVQAALARIIGEREQKAASYATAGKTELAKAERAEIDVLRGFLRMAGPEVRVTAPKAQPGAAAPTAAPATGGPLFSRTQMIIGGVAAVALAVILFLLLKPSDEPETALAAGNQTTAGLIRKDDRTMGDPNAPIVFIEYAAPTCSHCAHFATAVFPNVKREYIDKGKVFYVFRAFPLNPIDGAVEAIARQCLPADKYFDFIDLMFRNQRKWLPSDQVTDIGAAIKSMARVKGVTPENADRCMTDRNEQERINQVAQDAITRYDVQGTPTFVVNGTVVQAAEGTWPLLKARFDALLSKK